MHTMDANTLLVLWSLSGALSGAVVTPLLLVPRGYSLVASVLLGMGLGGVGNLLTLLPLWLLLGRHGAHTGRMSNQHDDNFRVRIESLTLDAAALKYPEVEPCCPITDAASGEFVIQATRFQLEYLKSRMAAPRKASEGWYVLRRLLPLLPLDAESLEEEGAARLAQLEDLAQNPPDETTLPLNKLEAEARTLRVKAAEIHALHDALLTALGEDDAFEVEWDDANEGGGRATAPFQQNPTP